MISKKIGDFIKRHKKKAVTGVLMPFAGWALAYFKDPIMASMKNQEARVEISTSTQKVELHKRVDIAARVDSLGLSDLSPGAISLESDPQYLSIKPSKSVKLEGMSGSQPIDNLPEVKAIKIAPSPVKITATYVSGDLKVQSNALFIEIIQPKKVLHPHFDRSDTSRVNLSGEWIIEVGGDPGKMIIVQRPDNSITGTYEIPQARWPRGTISGYKDGATFRVHFSIPGKEKTEDLRVAGHFEILSSNGDYIEVTGCAYHLRRSSAVYNKVGTEGVDCSRPAYYNKWKVLQSATFYATAPFDKQDQD